MGSSSSKGTAAGASPSTKATGNFFRKAPKKEVVGVSVLSSKTKNVSEVYNIGTTLGEGSFGICRLGTDRKTGKEVAIKTISKGKLLTDEDASDIRNEIVIMEAVSGHPSIVRIFGAYEDNDNVHIVLELCKGGDLFDSIISKGKYSEKDCATLCRQMLQMLEHCHQKNIIHRDLKPENFLLELPNNSQTLKATDFGLSCFFKESAELNDPCGTPMYIAPEVIRGKYTQKADIWSAGVVLYILLSGKVPFFGKTDEDILRMTLKGKYNLEKEPWPHISDEAKDCVRRMLQVEPERRPSAKDMLAHPWMKEDGIASDKPLVNSVLDNLNAFNNMSKFKRRALQVMATNMNEADLQAVRKAFDAVDVDNSGTITVEEMKSALEHLGNKVAEEKLLEMFNAFDLDGNGTMEYEEFLTATANLSKLNTADNFRYAFRQFDKDGDGSITVDEVFDALKDIGVEESQAREIVRDADLNQDGVIDYEEFVYMMTKKEKLNEAANQVRKKHLHPLAEKALK